MIKCSALRDVRKAVKPCGRNGKLEFDGFCCYEHQQDALKYSGTAYPVHVANYRRALENKALVGVFNDDLRFAFVSVQEAGRKHEREQFLHSCGAEYAGFVKVAWESVASVATQGTEQMHDSIQQARMAKAGAKRVRNQGMLASMMRSASADAEHYEPFEQFELEMPPMPSPNPAPTTRQRKDDVPVDVLLASHVPLPDADAEHDELMED